MYPEMLYDNEITKDPVTFDIYPDGISNFELYEDDGITREHREGAYTKTLIECDAPSFGNAGIVTVTVGESQGEYEGKPSERSYWFEIHLHFPPNGVLLNEVVVFEEFNTMEELEAASDGWFYDPDLKGGIAFVKTQALTTNESFDILIDALLGTEEHKTNRHISIIPNPTNGLVTVNSEVGNIKQIMVFNTGGNSLADSISFEIQDKNASLDLTNLPNGIYYIEIVTDQGKYSEKITLMK